MKFVLSAIVFATATAQAQSISRACEPNGGFFREFPGRYTVKIQMGFKGPIFHDELEITQITRKSEMTNGHEKFDGTFKVPNVFESRIGEGSLAFNSISPERVDMHFQITARENGREFPVYFKTTSQTAHACLLKGHAYSPTPEKYLGTVAIVKTTPDCVCFIGERPQ